MAVGKIASSTANYSTLGKTSVKNAANGFTGFSRQDPYQFQQCEVFAPSLNLGVSVINTVVPATQGYTNYSQGPGIEGGVGYHATFTENNITIVKPNALPTNPAFSDGRSFDRYETSFLDMARGLSSSVVIGGDWFTVQDFYTGGLNTPEEGFITFGSDFGNSTQVLIGMKNFQGVGATSTPGYGYSHLIRNNLIVGSNNGNRPLRDDGNFAYLYPDYGYTLGYESEITKVTIVGHSNVNGLIRGTGYNAGINYRSFTMLGYGNYNLPQEKTAAGGYQRQRIQAPGGASITIGTDNVKGYLQHINNWTGTPFEMPQFQYSDIIIGNSCYSSSMMDFANPGDPFPFAGQQINFANTIIGRVNNFRERLELSPGWSGYTTQIKGNLVFNTGYSGGPAVSMAQDNVFIGDRVADNNEMGADGAGWSNMRGNVTIGRETLNRHGIFDVEVNTNYNTIIGTEAQTRSTGLTNCTVIGYQATATATNASNEITLGNSSISALRCNVTSITSLSDARDKANIEPISNASAFIKDLKPVKFDWNRRDGVKAKEHDIGFLAQDLDEAQSKHGIQEHLDIVYKSNPEALEASYGKLLPILVQALKEQQEEIEKLKSTN